MTRPQPRTPAPPPSPRRRGPRRTMRMTVGISLLIAGGTGVTVGAAAYSRSAETNTAAIVPATANATAGSTGGRLLRSELADEANRAGVVSRSAPTDAPTDAPAAAPTSSSAAGNESSNGSRTVLPGLTVEIGELRVATDRSGVKATSLPLNVTNTGSMTKSFDITVHALDAEGALITSDVGTATNLRPGQSAAVQVLEIAGNELAEQLDSATFEVADAFAY